MDIRVGVDGFLRWFGAGGAERRVRCAVGRGGIAAGKREGDGVTPAGRWPMRRVHYRPDRVVKPACRLPLRPIGADDGWCDDPACPAYNRLVALPHPGGHETLSRDDALYDIVVEIGYNDDPPRPGRGSAVFLHISKPDYAPTAGCVAIARADMLALLGDLGGDAWIAICD